MFDIAYHQIRPVHHAPISDLNCCLWMAPSGFITDLNAVVVFVKGVCIFCIFGFRICQHPDEFAIVVSDVTLCPSDCRCYADSFRENQIPNVGPLPGGVFCWYGYLEGGFERRLLATVRWTVATAVAFPQKSESTFPPPEKKPLLSIGQKRFLFNEINPLPDLAVTAYAQGCVCRPEIHRKV